MKKNKKLVAIMCAVMVAVSCVVPTMACTPPLNPPHVEIPDIEVKFDDKMQEAFANAAKKFWEKNTLTKPAIQKATYIHRTMRYSDYACLSVRWDKVEGAVYYEVEVTKADDAHKIYKTSYTALIRANYSDDFLADGMDGATVRVKAYGEDETFSLWSDVVDMEKIDF
nr:MAG TPA: coagulation factor VII precursor [Caudoviricetes sp.]